MEVFMEVNLHITDIDVNPLSDGVVIGMFGDGIAISILLDNKQSKILLSEITDVMKSTKTDHPIPPTIPKEGV